MYNTLSEETRAVPYFVYVRSYKMCFKLLNVSCYLSNQTIFS